jgi:hypothetical protein
LAENGACWLVVIDEPTVALVNYPVIGGLSFLEVILLR